MSNRISNDAPPGSLLKRPGMYTTKIKETFRTPRIHDSDHLKAVRRLPCAACGAEPCEAAHIRKASASHGKRATGMGERPDDKWAVPLCKACHDEQHKLGELTFWYNTGLSPFLLALRLSGVSPDVRRMREVIISAWNDDDRLSD